MGRGHVLLSFALALIMQYAPAHADGAFFSVAAAVREPAQKAVVWQRAGRETLILSVKYEGAAGDFGWVVPVPSRPQISAAPVELFYELAWVTRPRLVSGWGRPVTVNGASPGVEVVESARVGPLDVTVLTAVSSQELTRWLDQHGYKLPPGTEQVLRPYVEHHWYFVATHIETARLDTKLLQDLQAVDASVTSLEKAPEELAKRVLELADTDPAAGRELLRRIASVTDRAQAIPAHLDAPWAWSRDPLASPAGGEAIVRYGRYVDERATLMPSLIAASDTAAYQRILVEGGGCSSQSLLAAAKAAGVDQVSSLDAMWSSVAERARGELMSDTAWGESVLGKMTAGLPGMKRGKVLAAVDKLRADYETRRELVREQFLVPPGAGLRSGLRVRAEKLLVPEAQRWGYLMACALHDRGNVYAWTARIVAGAREAVETALAAGTLQPLRLDFASKDLVYPLYLTRLSRGSTEIQLYVLSDHRVTAKGFDTVFAQKLGSTLLHGCAETAKLAKGGTSYLTALRAEMAPEDITSDVVLAKARSDRPVHRTITVGSAWTFRRVSLIVVAAGMAGVLARRWVTKRARGSASSDGSGSVRR